MTVLLRGHEEKTSAGECVPQQSITTGSFHQTGLNNVGSLMRPLHWAPQDAPTAPHPPWGGRQQFTQERVDGGLLPIISLMFFFCLFSCFLLLLLFFPLQRSTGGLSIPLCAFQGTVSLQAPTGKTLSLSTYEVSSDGLKISPSNAKKVTRRAASCRQRDHFCCR